MITEDYCSYEISKLLKEKGFDGVCDYAYSNKGNYFEIDRSNFDEVYCLRPTHQMAMKWLRENYDLHIIVFPYKRGTSAKGWCCQVFLTYNLLGYDKYTNETCNSYEDAVEAALKYSLENLI